MICCQSVILLQDLDLQMCLRQSYKKSVTISQWNIFSQLAASRSVVTPWSQYCSS